jgi:phosphoenolpyruvate carboxykinase-like protein
VRHPDSEADIWWGPVNIPLDSRAFAINRERARDYLNSRERLYCFDGFAGWDPKYRIKVRVICSRPYHALFMHTMLIRPTEEQLEKFGAPDFIIYNAGAFPANQFTSGTGSKTSVELSLEEKELVILGTEYAGEMKKGVFTVANYFAPKTGVLSMHCSATAKVRKATWSVPKCFLHPQSPDWCRWSTVWSPILSTENHKTPGSRTGSGAGVHTEAGWRYTDDGQKHIEHDDSSEHPAAAINRNTAKRQRSWRRRCSTSSH